MSYSLTFYGFFLCAILASSCNASILRVPDSFPTIQSAFDALNNQDTISVDAGIYPEALIAPPLSFYMFGNVVSDTGELSKPTIDPSSLSGADTIACMIFPEASYPVIENFRFRTGTAIYPRAVNRSSGIVNYSENPVFKRCEFDSLFWAIFRGHQSLISHIVLENCNFNNDSAACIFAGWGSIYAENCLFTGRGSFLVQANGGSEFYRCHFRDNNQGNLLLLSGNQNVIDGCIFGPYGPWGFAAVELGNFSGSITNNLFNECLLGPCALSLSSDCVDSTYITGNTFANNRVVMGGGSGGINVQCENLNSVGIAAIIQNNIFTNITANNIYKGLVLSNYTICNNNQFRNITPFSPSTVGTVDTSTGVHNNIFINTGMAAEVVNLQIFPFRFLNAINNYWGDPTGPYHPTLNPDGQGDEVGDNVLFSPWYTDTLFFNDTGDPFIPQPSSFTLSVYPNPFNSAAKIKIEVPNPMIVKVELFDLLGRRVKELYNAPVVYERELSFTADNFPSGVYFVRAKNAIENRSLATKKLLLMK